MDILLKLISGHDPFEKSFLVLVAMAIIMLVLSHISAGTSETGNLDVIDDIRDRTRPRPLKNNLRHDEY